jgi:hypothetical protein
MAVLTSDTSELTSQQLAFDNITINDGADSMLKTRIALWHHKMAFTGLRCQSAFQLTKHAPYQL